MCPSTQGESQARQHPQPAASDSPQLGVGASRAVPALGMVEAETSLPPLALGWGKHMTHGLWWEQIHRLGSLPGQGLLRAAPSCSLGEHWRASLPISGTGGVPASRLPSCLGSFPGSALFVLSQKALCALFTRSPPACRPGVGATPNPRGPHGVWCMLGGVSLWDRVGGLSFLDSFACLREASRGCGLGLKLRTGSESRWPTLPHGGPEPGRVSKCSRFCESQRVLGGPGGL